MARWRLLRFGAAGSNDSTARGAALAALLLCLAGCPWHHHGSGETSTDGGQVVAHHVHGPGYAAWFAARHSPEPVTADSPDSGPLTGPLTGTDSGTSVTEGPPDAGDEGQSAHDDAGATGAADDTPPRSPLVVDAKNLPRITARRLWSAATRGAGTASPQLADLNADGVQDIVISGWFPGERASIWALDGATGKALWRAVLPEEVYATAALVDLDRDGTPDAVVGGRDNDGTAFNGRDGGVLWSLRNANPAAEIPKRSFNGAMVVPDQDSDGVADLVFSQGGSQDDKHRLPGRIFVVSGSTGRILVDTTPPDGREIYSMPAIVPGANPLELIVGTGGETLPGHLYRLTPGAVGARWGVASKTKGFISSPIVYDFAGDGGFDVVASSFEGTLMRVDGATGEIRWQVPRAGQEGYPSPALGAFGGGSTLDAVAVYSRGTYPQYHLTNTLIWVDGKTGEVLDTRTHGVYASSSPLVADLDGDGFDETISVSMDSFDLWRGEARSTIGIFDGHRGKAVRLALQVVGSGSATPHLSDLDGDGRLDLILSYLHHVERYVLEVKGGGAPRVRWDGFRGPRHDGVLVREPAAPHR